MKRAELRNQHLHLYNSQGTYTIMQVHTDSLTDMILIPKIANKCYSKV